MKNGHLYNFKEDQLSFIAREALRFKTIYFPLCGTDATGLKSSITPYLSGDIKVDKYRYVTKPVSTEDLRQPLRNFYLYTSAQELISLAQPKKDENSYIEAGMLWHKQVRTFPQTGLKIEALNFVPVSGESVELMQVKVTNISDQKISFIPTGAVPIFGRSLANKHDHEHVTSLLNRITQVEGGVVVTPTMVFNEEGHLANDTAYFVFGFEGSGQKPMGTFPTIESFCGSAGDLYLPEAVTENRQPQTLTESALQGKEAAGALRFGERTLAPGESRDYFLIVGITRGTQKPKDIFKKFSSPKDFDKALRQNQDYWQEKSAAIVFKTGDKEFNAWMQWVLLQPVLRRIYGCSFLPDHDYGKGGKGWRDIWQDLLSLILIEPGEVRQTLINNFAGVRIDGSNATIIGAKPGEFIADRNDITRVWMDHGAWPLLTLVLYINQTGDLDILLEKAPYFRDKQLSRNFRRDLQWNEVYGNKLKSLSGERYTGTVLEHLIVQTLIPFFNVGEHNHFRLESADWNDGLDMAFERGESVAFSAFYAGNFLILANLLRTLKERKKQAQVTLAKELGHLFSFYNHDLQYDDSQAKKKLLFDQYFPAVEPEISGETIEVSLDDLIKDFQEKGEWVFEHIRKTEVIQVNGHRWFNGYYDNQARRVEGKDNGRVRMTLTGQVFPIMSGCASEDEIKSVVEASNAYLKDPDWQGYRLNTDFGLPHYMDLGRAFGFAFGTKENGAFFSHMTVMYANALYNRGFAREGFEVLNSIYRMCENSLTSKIFPGIPEYMDSQGRGMYHYLTGSASWFVLTMVTQVFGIKGDVGDLVLEPQLVAEQFDPTGAASIETHFAGKRLTFKYSNPAHKDAGNYAVTAVCINGKPVDFEKLAPAKVKIGQETLGKIKTNSTLQVDLA